MARRRKGCKQTRVRRRNLWLADPHCHWCGSLTALPGAATASGLRLATIDHLFSRFHPVRQETASVPTVLACRECNAERGRQEGNPPISRGG